MSAAAVMSAVALPTAAGSEQRSQQQRRKRDSANAGQPSQPHKQPRTPTNPNPQHHAGQQLADNGQQPRRQQQQFQSGTVAAQSQQNGGVDGAAGRGRRRRGRGGGGGRPSEQTADQQQQQPMEVDIRAAPSQPSPAPLPQSVGSTRTQPSADSFIASADSKFDGITFNDLKLLPSLLRAIAQVGYKSPTPIQQKAIPFALTGRDVLGCAQTGTGNTEAQILGRLDYAASSQL